MIEKKLLTIAGVFFGVAIGIFILLSNVINQFLKKRNTVLVYTLLFVLGFSFIAFAGFEGIFKESWHLLILLQLLFLILGIIHVNVIYDTFEWALEKKFFPELGFTAFLWILGIIPFTLILSLVNDSQLYFWLAGGSIFFIIPLFFVRSFDYAISIPDKILKKWLFPVNERIEDPTDDEMKEPFIVSLLIERKAGNDLTQFKIKAPKRIRVGKLFYFFIEDYNDQHPETPIEVVDRFGQPHSWQFYFQPKWGGIFGKVYVDPDLTVYQNGIRENSIIICERLYLN